MNDRRPSLLRIRALGHGIHELPGFDTSYFCSFVVRLDPHETRLAIDRSAETLLLVAEGTRMVVWRDTTRVSTALGEGDRVLTNPPAVEVLLAGAEGATFLALVSRGYIWGCVMQLASYTLAESCVKQLPTPPIVHRQRRPESSERVICDAPDPDPEADQTDHRP